MVGLHQHPKNGGFWFKRGIPERLRPFFPDRGQTWNENLKTKDEAEARLRVLDVARRVESLFQQAEQRLVAETPVRPLAPSVLTGMVALWKERELWCRAEMVLQGDPMPGWPAFIDEAATVGFGPYKPPHEDPEEFMARLQRQSAFIEAVIDELCDEMAILLPAEHPGRPVLFRMVEQAWLSIIELEDRWRSHDFAELPTTPPRMPPAPQVPLAPPSQLPVIAATTPVERLAKDSGPTIKEALENWKSGGAHKAKVPAPRTILEASTAVRRFVELHGDLPIRAIQKHHARELRDLLAKVPVNLTAEQRALSLKALVGRNVTGPLPTAQTLNKTMNLLSAVLSNADRDGHFDGMHWSNPFRLQLRLDDDAQESYEPFTLAELKKLIGSPVFAEGARPKRGRGETAKWAPLVGLFHGMRRGEVLQLLVSDVRQEEGSGLWFLDVRPDEHARKRVKNSGSKRRVPLHPDIQTLGFLRFVAERRKAIGDDASLWPGFEDRAKLASRSNNWAEWFHGYLAEHVVDAETKKFHSFRGTFKRFGEDAGAEPAIIKRIIGHALVGVSDKNYGRRKDEDGRRDQGVSLSRMAAEIERVSFGVDFSAVA